MDTAFKNECIALRKEGHSIIEIMHITGRAKTSIYTHIKTVPLSPERWLEIKKASGEHIRTFALARKGKSNRPFKKFSQWTPEMVLLVAHLLFDGELKNGRCTYNNRSKALIQRVEQLMKRIYTFDPKRYTNPLTGVHRLAYYNVALGNYLCEKSKKLLDCIESCPKPLKREFLRAFFDDEGCIYVKAGKRQVRGYQKDQATLFLVQNLLRDFLIDTRVQLPNEVVIRGKASLQAFQKEINFSPGVRINGKRSNSIWKRHLEKRVLLDRAIKSFKH